MQAHDLAVDVQDGLAVFVGDVGVLGQAEHPLADYVHRRFPFVLPELIDGLASYLGHGRSQGVFAAGLGVGGSRLGVRTATARRGERSR